jgi:UDPglucose 6-dehydrogenase
MLAQKYKREDTLVFSPEYIGEGGYPVPFWENIPHPTEMRTHSFHIFGGSKTATAKIIEFFKPVAGPFAKFIQTDSTTAELTKYMENAWIATKVTFVNEFYNIADVFHVDYNELRELWLLDGRTNRSHTLVYPEKRGFDGKCIPKDTSGILEAAKKAGYTPQLLSAVIEANDRFRGV